MKRAIAGVLLLPSVIAGQIIPNRNRSAKTIAPFTLSADEVLNYPSSLGVAFFTLHRDGVMAMGRGYRLLSRIIPSGDCLLFPLFVYDRAVDRVDTLLQSLQGLRPLPDIGARLDAFGGGFAPIGNKDTPKR